MSRQNYRYFTLPFAKVPDRPDYTVWFYTWSAKRSEYVWSRERPRHASDATPTWVVAASDATELPADATVIIPSSAKCIDPPPLTAPSGTLSEADFQAALTTQLARSLEGIKSL